MREDEARFFDRVRRVLAVALLFLLAASMAATLSPGELSHRVRRFARSIAGEAVLPSEGTGFWFDPAYAAFLEDVRRRTPENATVAVLAPAWPDVYTYQAAYRLAPRRVVGSGLAHEATFVATYRTEREPAGQPIRHGTLWRR